MELVIRRKGNKRAYFACHDYQELILSSLERFRDRVKQVCLYVEDVNGHRRGIDKKCRCVLHLKRMAPIVIQDMDASMNALMHRIANRASYVLSQKADRISKRVKRAARSSGQPQAERSDAVEVDEVELMQP